MSMKLPNMTVMSVVPAAHVGTPWLQKGPRNLGGISVEMHSCMARRSWARPPCISARPLGSPITCGRSPTPGELLVPDIDFLEAYGQIPRVRPPGEGVLWGRAYFQLRG